VLCENLVIILSEVFAVHASRIAELSSLCDDHQVGGAEQEWLLMHTKLPPTGSLFYPFVFSQQTDFFL
jgi:hypothetical protein